MPYKNEFSWGDDIIDSHDINKKYDELLEEREDLRDALEKAKEVLSEVYDDPASSYTDKLEAEQCVETAKDNLGDFDDGDLQTLSEVVDEGRSSPDWTYGETLIHENYFTEYIKDLIDDCYEIPEEFKSGNWPYRHMNIDYDAAAEEAKIDYFTIDADGHTYYIRA